MSAVYINGFSGTCALGEHLDNFGSVDLNRTFCAPIAFQLDNEAISVNYFSAFQQPLLSQEIMLANIESHILAAIAMAGWPSADLVNIAIFLGSTSFLISTHEKTLSETAPELQSQTCSYQTFSLDPVADWLAEKYQHQNIFTLATSCTSSANALLYAKQYLDLGYCQRAIVIGFESFNWVTLQGFHSLGLLAGTNAQPFSTASDGLVLGEGIACLAISHDKSSLAGQVISLKGGATQGDTHNITSTLANGDKVRDVIVAALQHANVTIEQIKAIKAHGTGSPVNDRAEGLGIRQLFSPTMPVILFKPYIGHTLGACGVLECLLMIKCLINRKLPALPYPYTSDMDLPVQVVKDGCHLEDGDYLLNYLGFGGNNTVLVIGMNV